MPLILGAQSATGAAEVVTNSCRFDGSSDYLHKTLSSPGNRRKWTFSCWAKRCVQTGSDHIFGAPQNSSNYDQIYFAGTVFRFDHWISGSSAGSLVTDRVFRDPTAWYHIVCVWDSDNADASLRMRLYVNGTEETSFSTDTNPSLNADSYVNSTSYPFEIGAMNTGEYYNGYLAEVVFIDGLALTASDFGEFDTDSPTIWKPKSVSGLTFGTNGFYLDFKDSANLGNDASGGTDFTEVNLAATDQATDTPTNNFCTVDPLASNAETYAEGNLKVDDLTGSSNTPGARSTMGVRKGKWYCEIKCTAVGASMLMGICEETATMSILGDFQAMDGTLMYRNDGKSVYFPGGGSGASYGDTYTSGDIIGIALDMDNRDVYFYKNGTIQNSGTAAFTSSNIVANTFYFPMQAGYNVGIAEYNFGGCETFTIASGNADANGYGNFEYAVPSGYLAMCTQNLGSDGG